MSHTVVIPLGTGGGVVMGPQGDTNFAIVPNADPAILAEAKRLGTSPEDVATRVLAGSSYWLLDCGPQTAGWLCGGYGGVVTPELSHVLLNNLKGIIFTHAHTDHMGGLAMLMWRFIFVEKIQPAIIAHYELETAIRRMTDEIRYWNGAQLTTLLGGDSFEVTPKYKERFRPELEQFLHLRWATTGYTGLTSAFDKIELFRVDHNIDGFPAFGVKFVPHESDVNLVFSGDTCRPLPAELLLDSANEVFHDCQTFNLDKATAVHCHLDWLKAAVPVESRANRVFLVHTRTQPEDLGGFEWAPRFKILEF